MRTLVLGLGNEYAGDDAVGVLAVRALHDELAGEADVVESSASGLALLEVFAGYDRAVVVDSIRTGRAPAGTIVKTGLAELGPATAPSLHQTGIPSWPRWPSGSAWASLTGRACSPSRSQVR